MGSHSFLQGIQELDPCLLPCRWTLYCLSHQGSLVPTDVADARFNPWVGKMPWSRKWQPALVFLPGKFHRQRSLAGYSPWVSQRGYDLATEHARACRALVALGAFSGRVCLTSIYVTPSLECGTRVIGVGLLCLQGAAVIGINQSG